MHILTAADRRVGRLVRRHAAAHPGIDRVARTSSVLLAPAFEGLVAALVAGRATRPSGLRAGAAAVAGATVAKALRDAIDRPRPGPRHDGGFPSRHAAAASAIVRSVGRSNRPAGRVLLLVATAGLVGRIVTSDHDPADIVAGVVVGAAVEAIVNRAVDRATTG